MEIVPLTELIFRTLANKKNASNKVIHKYSKPTKLNTTETDQFVLFIFLDEL